ncbi:MAG: GreA/GreB family elongation factor [Candidatus Eremiobacteraeota bacterium]|nr:GreA/GreB family elongation factor [Candidatus Eremiobacteraeota bacterium]
MSRGFVKDDDDRPERPLPRPVDVDRPNYVTARGLKLLEEALEAARAAGDARNVEYYQTRIETAELVPPPKAGAKKVAFGSTVVLRDGTRQIRMQIVGEDEADPAHGTISWSSPYAQALLENRVGDRVVVHRPAGDATVVIESIEPT